MGLLANNGKYYAATSFGQRQRQSRITVAQNPFEDNVTFIAATQVSNRLWLYETAQFTSMHETSDHVYVFAREPAFEVDAGNAVVYSRAIRVCKTDVGIMEDSIVAGDIPRWQTYQKLRMKCSHGSPNLAYDYNEMKSTQVYVPVTSNTSNADPTIYATFSSAANGPKGAAICKFSFSSMTNIFESGEYLVKEDTNVWKTMGPAQFACPGSPGRQRTNTEATNNLLMANSLDANTLYTIEGEEYTQIAVDVYWYRQMEYEVLYVGTDSGKVWANIRVAGVNLIQHQIFTPVDGQAKPITHLLLDKSLPNEVRKLYVATRNYISELTLGNCTGYKSCTECLESNDPYCVWLDNTHQCHNKLTNHPILGSIETVRRNDVAGICRVPVSTPQPSPTVQSSTSVAVSRSSAIPISSTVFVRPPVQTVTLPPRGSLGTRPPTSLPIGGTVGIAIGALFAGLAIGMVLCLVGLLVKRMLTKAESTEPVMTHHSSNISNGGTHNADVENVFVVPPGVPEEWHDDVIKELPTLSKKAGGRAKKGRGRTESTRWLKESESDTPPSPP